MQYRTEMAARIAAALIIKPPREMSPREVASMAWDVVEDIELEGARRDSLVFHAKVAEMERDGTLQRPSARPPT